MGSLLRAFVFFAVFAWGLLTAVPAKAEGDVGVQGINAERAQALRQGIFEVVIPKVFQDATEYEKPLPWDRLAFKDRNDKYQSIGTAFLIGPGTFVSAAHVFALEDFTLRGPHFLRDWRGNIYAISTVTKYSTYRDAIQFGIQGQVNGAQVIEIGLSPQPGEVVFTAGNAQGEGISFRNGTLASMTPEPAEGKWNYLRFSAPASPGNSGGPLLNAKGQVIGVVTMKNASENLNFALPMSEVQAMSTSAAEFYLKDTFIGEEDNKVFTDIKGSVPLPAPPIKLAPLLQAEVGKQFQALIARFFKEKAATLFPAAPESTEYLLSPTLSAMPGIVGKTSNRKYAFSEFRGRSLDLGPQQKISFFYSDQKRVLFHLERPKAIPLRTFATQPKLWLDSFLKATGMGRNFGGEKIKITSLGPPIRTIPWDDAIGRRWTSSLWLSKYDNSFTYLNCMTLPDGVSCEVTEGAASHLGLGLETLYRKQVHTLALPYTGTLAEWQEYFALPAPMRPKLLERANLKFVPRKSLMAIIGGLELKLATSHLDPKVSSESMLTLMTSIHPADRGRQIVMAASLVPDPTDHYGYHGEVEWEPKAEMPDDLRKRWAKMVGHKEPFDGRVFSKNATRHMVSARILPGRSPASQAGSPRVVITEQCSRSDRSTEYQVKSACRAFFSGFSLVPR